jgi:hypothetical protein
MFALWFIARTRACATSVFKVSTFDEDPYFLRLSSKMLSEHLWTQKSEHL